MESHVECRKSQCNKGRKSKGGYWIVDYQHGEVRKHQWSFGCRILQVVSLSTLAIHVESVVRPVVGQL
jgi:hypothetical protein